MVNEGNIDFLTKPDKPQIFFDKFDCDRKYNVRILNWCTPRIVALHYVRGYLEFDSIVIEDIDDIGLHKGDDIYLCLPILSLKRALTYHRTKINELKNYTEFYIDIVFSRKYRSMTIHTLEIKPVEIEFDPNTS